MSDFDRLMGDSLKAIRDDHVREIESQIPAVRSQIATKIRGRRFTFVIGAVAVAAASVAVALFITQSAPNFDRSEPIRPAAPSDPTPSEKPKDSVGYDILDGEVTFRAAEPWEPHVEALMIAEGSLPSEFTLVTRFDKSDASCRSPSSSCADFTVVADPAPRQDSCARTGGTVVSAETLAMAIGAHPGLESTAPVSERIDGIDALRLDVAVVDGALTCEESGEGIEYGDGVPVLTHTRRTKLGAPIVAVVDPGKRMRVYLLDLPGGAAAQTLAIMIVAREADFDVAVEAARPILDSFEFQVAP